MSSNPSSSFRTSVTMKESSTKHRFRAVLAQTIAVTVKNFLLLDMGVSSAIPIILVPALTGLSSESNPNETIRITAAEASWLGSMLTIFTIVGSLLSGIVTEPLGRKRAMLLVNIPHLFGWFLLYFSTSLTQIFIGMSLLGLGVGLTEAPIITYVGEICEPSVRDVMISSSGISATTGYLFVFLIGSSFDWRTVALICVSIPIAALFALLFIPETPIWLLSRYRDGEAMEALQWLRGWVSEAEVQPELDALKEYREFANSCSNCQVSKIKCSHPQPTLSEKIKQLSQASYARPLLIITICTFFTNFAGAHSLSPYLAQILNTFETPMSPNYSTILFGLTAFVGTITCMLVAKIVTKRQLYMICISSAAALNLWLGLHGLYYLPENSKSFEHASEPNIGNNASYIPLVLVVVMRFFTNGILNVPIMYQSELFPLKSRCIAAGVSEALSKTILFVAIKTFYDLELWLNMSFTFCIYGVIGFIGMFAAYKIFPLTEDRTLEEIEKHYSDKRNKLTDWRISKKQ